MYLATVCSVPLYYLLLLSTVTTSCLYFNFPDAVPDTLQDTTGDPSRETSQVLEFLLDYLFYSGLDSWNRTRALFFVIVVLWEQECALS